MPQDYFENFFDTLRSNQKENSVLFANWYGLLAKLDDCFFRASNTVAVSGSVLTESFLDRCRYAYMTSISLAFAGQIVEIYPLLRLVLELSAYCLIVHDDPTLSKIFEDRHDGGPNLHAHKKEFNSSAARNAVKRHDTRLATIYSDLYQRTIDFGGHPNPISIYASVDFLSRNGKRQMKTTAISDDPLLLEAAFKITGQCGLAALHVLEKADKERFETLGITKDMLGFVVSGLL